mgnify:CR=1 FL=1
MEELYRFLAPEEVVEGAFENLWVQGRYGFTGCVTNHRVLFVGTTRRIGFERERIIEIPLDAISSFEVEVRERDLKLLIAGVLLIGVGILFSLLVPQFAPAGVVYVGAGIGCIVLSRRLKKKYLVIEAKGLALTIEGIGDVAEEMASTLKRALEKVRSGAERGS